MVFFLLNTSSLSWSLGGQFPSLRRLSGILKSWLKWVFLLGKPIEESFDYVSTLKKECSCGQIDIFFEKSKGNQLITFFFTVSNILFIRSSLGYSLHGYRNFIKLVWLLCSKKTKEGLEGCSLMHILDVRKETDKRLKAKRCRIKSWNVSS